MVPAISMIVAMLLAGAASLACGTDRQSDSGAPPAVAGPSPVLSPTQSSAPWPNEPPGMTVLTDWAMDQAVPAGGDVAIAGSPGWHVAYEVTPGGTRGWAERA